MESKVRGNLTEPVGLPNNNLLVFPTGSEVLRASPRTLFVLLVSDGACVTARERCEDDAWHGPCTRCGHA